MAKTHAKIKRFNKCYNKFLIASSMDKRDLDELSDYDNSENE